jgi:hypothetical protein
LDSEFRSKFEDVATQAAIALGCPPDADLVKFWLFCLCSDLLQNSPDGGRRELLHSVPDGGFFVDLLGSSAAYCSRLAAKADIKTHIAHFRGDTPPDLDSPLPESEMPHQSAPTELEIRVSHEATNSDRNINDGAEYNTPVGAPEDRLRRFMEDHPGSTYADIRYSARVHKPEFQDWRKGKLSTASVMAKRIENVLSGSTPLQKKPPKQSIG